MSEVKAVFEDYEAPAPVNPYADTLAALAEATESNPKASVVFEFPADAEQRETFKVQRAANDIDKTAKVRDRDESGVIAGVDKEGNPTVSGIVKVRFQLTAKHAARRTKGDKSVSAEVPAAVDAAE